MVVLCARMGKVSPTKIARTMLRDRGKITRFIDRLEERELLVRQVNERDHRVRVIRPTNKARRIAPHLQMVFGQIHKRFFAGITSEDVAKLVEILSKLSANAERLNDDI